MCDHTILVSTEYEVIFSALVSRDDNNLYLYSTVVAAHLYNTMIGLSDVISIILVDSCCWANVSTTTQEPYGY